MDRISELRGLAKQQYTALRRSLNSFEERVVAQHWTDDTVVRSGFDQVLGSLDRLAGWLLVDDEISRHGQNLIRGEISGSQRELPAAQDEQTGPDDAEEPVVTEPVVTQPPVSYRLVDVTFTLPAEVRADSVALCGEFNQWSVNALQLEHGTDGNWRTTVALEPGHSYRYRYLLDGERWENDPRADAYAPNPYGTSDSVVIVGALPQD